MNDKRCVKPMDGVVQKRPILRRVRTDRERPNPGFLDFGKPTVRRTVIPRTLQLVVTKGLEPHERRLAEQRVDKNMNDALKMSNGERVEKYGVVDMKNIHAKLFNTERKKIISMREKKMKAPECPVVRPVVRPVAKPMVKVVSPHQLIKEFLRNSPVQIIRPKKTIAELAAENNPAPPQIPKMPMNDVHGRIAKRAGLKIAKLKQPKHVGGKGKRVVPEYNKAKCSKKTSNKPHTVSELRRIAKDVGVSVKNITEAKSSVRKLCELIDAKNNKQNVNKNAENMKHRLEHAKAVMIKERMKKNSPNKKEHKIVSPKKDGTHWMDRTPHSRKRHMNADDDVYKKALSTLKKDDPVMFLKMKGFNVMRVGRKTKANPNPHTQNNLMKIANELNINIATTSKKPKPTATKLISMIKKKLEKA